MIVLTDFGIDIVRKEVQPTKICNPNATTPSGMSNEVKLEQNWKASWPILVTLWGSVIDVKPEQPPKALSPMLVTLLGIVTEVMLVHSLKA
jgi:hypothetical protein